MDFFGDDEDEEGQGEGGSRDPSQLSSEERRNKRRWEVSQEILKFVLSRRDHLTQSEILMISEEPLCEQVCSPLPLSSRSLMPSDGRSDQEISSSQSWSPSRDLRRVSRSEWDLLSIHEVPLLLLFRLL